jgi:hypothetical protein
MSMKNSNETIGNRSCDLPVCIAVPQPTAPPRAPGILCTLCIVARNFIVSMLNSCGLIQPEKSRVSMCLITIFGPQILQKYSALE